ncbi:MAG: hypothetical protein NC548_35380 [Lachnospiraceae bacterium]|nr:hypothetical protein [Lachnospiraceae bacterium]
MADSTTELCSKLLMSWMLGGSDDAPHSFQGNDPEIINGGDPLSTILHQKLQWAGLQINIPDELYLIMSLCTQSPGSVQIMCHEILENIPNLEQGYTVMPEDFVRVYPMSFPIATDPHWLKHFEELWDAQKIERSSPGASDNACDTREYWMSLLKS